MDAISLPQLILPLALFLMMLGIGITLTGADFGRILQRPGAVLLGLLGQLLLLPLLGWLVVQLFGLPPLAACGLMILSLAPGGVTSNLITLVARGDTALSVTLTAISSLITPFTLPLLTALVLQLLGAGLQLPPFPVLPAMLKLLLVTLLPVALGVGLRARLPRFCQRLEPWVKGAALLFFLFMVVLLVWREQTRLPALLALHAPAVVTLVLVAMGSGFLLAWLGGLDVRGRVTLAVEVGIQNAGTALMVTGALLGSAEMSALVLIYGVLMQLPAAALMLWRNRPGFRAGALAG